MQVSRAENNSVDEKVCCVRAQAAVCHNLARSRGGIKRDKNCRNVVHAFDNCHRWFKKVWIALFIVSGPHTVWEVPPIGGGADSAAKASVKVGKAARVERAKAKKMAKRARARGAAPAARALHSRKATARAASCAFLRTEDSEH